MPKRKRSSKISAPVVSQNLKRMILGMRHKKMRKFYRYSKSRPNRNMHHFSRYTNDVRQNCTGTTFPFAIGYKFEDLKGYTDFTGLYDRYMITCVVHKFRLVSNPDATWKLNNPTVDSNVNGATTYVNSTNWYPKLWLCPDYDDAVAEAIDSLQERAKTKCIILRPNQHYKHVVRPAVTVQTYRTALSAGYAPKWNQWIDAAQTDVPHYGLKCVIDTSAQDPVDTQPFILEYTTKVYFKMKDVR